MSIDMISGFHPIAIALYDNYHLCRWRQRRSLASTAKAFSGPGSGN